MYIGYYSCMKYVVLITFNKLSYKSSKGAKPTHLIYNKQVNNSLNICNTDTDGPVRHQFFVRGSPLLAGYVPSGSNSQKKKSFFQL